MPLNNVKIVETGHYVLTYQGKGFAFDQIAEFRVDLEAGLYHTAEGSRYHVKSAANPVEVIFRKNQYDIDLNLKDNIANKQTVLLDSLNKVDYYSSDHDIYSKSNFEEVSENSIYEWINIVSVSDNDRESIVVWGEVELYEKPVGDADSAEYNKKLVIPLFELKASVVVDARIGFDAQSGDGFSELKFIADSVKPLAVKDKLVDFLKTGKSLLVLSSGNERRLALFDNSDPISQNEIDNFYAIEYQAYVEMVENFESGQSSLSQQEKEEKRSEMRALRSQLEELHPLVNEELKDKELPNIPLTLIGGILTIFNLYWR